MVKKASALLCLILLSACSDSIDSESGSGYVDPSKNTTSLIDFDKQAFIQNQIDSVFIPTLEVLATLTQSQVDAISQYCQNITEQNLADNLKASAQQSWQQTMSQWQKVEVMQLAPLLKNESKLRNQIYSWPSTNQCAVDQDVVHFENGSISGSPYSIENRTNTRRGLDALEYLLFAPNFEHSCSNESLAPAGWNTRSEFSQTLARCEFAEEVATDINTSVTHLLEQWQQDTGFAWEMLNSGNANSQFLDQNEVINHISDALFYIDTITKDAKLGAPIGLSANSCGDASCIEDIESRLSQTGLANIKSNLVGLKAIFTGGEGDQLGFDDYLKAAQAQELANTMLSDIEDAIAEIEQFDTSLQDAVATNPDQVNNLYAKVKKVTDNLKSVFITTLSLSLPLTSAGDAD